MFRKVQPKKKENDMNMFVDKNELSSAMCDLVDIMESLPDNVKLEPKDNDGTEFTIGDCLDSIMEFLASLESQVEG
jgi:hypothetical protein